MFQFPGLAFVPYFIQAQIPSFDICKSEALASFWLAPRRDRSLGITDIEGGFPHSEIHGSKLVRSSPSLIAAYHVLHRLSAPRHPPNTLKALDRSHYRCPPLGSGRAHSLLNANDTSIERPFASNASENVAVKQTSTAGMLADDL